jgi:hypothetical protein
VAAYHTATLSELVTHVAVENDRFRDGALEAFDVNCGLFSSLVLPELWKAADQARWRVPRHAQQVKVVRSAATQSASPHPT